MAMPEKDFYNLDASTFQEPLVSSAEVLAKKVKRRDGPAFFAHLGGRRFAPRTAEAAVSTWVWALAAKSRFLARLRRASE